MSETENSKNLDRSQSQSAARLAQVQPLRELARSWYALSVACRRMGAMIESDAKEILYTPTNNPESENKVKTKNGVFNE